MNFNEYIGKDMTEKERERVNQELEKIFKNSEIRRYISSLHPEISPELVSVEFDSDNIPHWIRMGYQTFVAGEYDPGWYRYGVKREFAYADDIIDFFKDHDPELHGFLSKL